ncbi:hypothetical protein IDH44_20605 [Paenibacillus sp. IB182496]|uniref:Uncharacterized protein n=1 Tax=Paenibacillus sabuli TaxID=2772509 RepID=A0A927BYE4_9BACL|nr:hypothetical protein [Paenibacillus sabuli]MBD2847598.1 hypothetical protein [Paenibacillus sabuli]
MKQALLGLDDWLFFPLAYLSIEEEPALCRQLVLAFVGKFAAFTNEVQQDWMSSETLRYARRLLRPFSANELATHLQRSERQARRTLQQLVERRLAQYFV